MATGVFSSAISVPVSDAGRSGLEPCSAEDSVSHRDIMKKLCDVCDQLSALNTTVQELRGEIFDLRQENDRLKKELELCRKREDRMEEVIKEAKFQAAVADSRVNDLEQYTRRNNVRVLGVPESAEESVEVCERKVLKIIKEKLELPIMESGDIEAIHRIGRQGKQKQGQPTRPRPIIVRFLSRKSTETVLSNRRKLKNTGIVIVEDLTHDNFVLLNKCWDHAGVADAWTRRGNIFVKTAKDSRVIRITSASDLRTVPEVPTSTPIPQSRRRRPAGLQRSDPSPLKMSMTSTGDKDVSTDSCARASVKQSE